MTTELQEFLWCARGEPLFAAHPDFHRRPPISRDAALAGLRRGWRYFAPVPRLLPGNRKPDCGTSFDALVVDIDREGPVDPDELLQGVEHRLPHALPSAVVYTGNRGIHLYWKLDNDLPIAEVERLNRALAVTLDGDLACHDRTRLFRHPGTIHPRSGNRCEIIDFAAGAHPLSAFDHLVPVPTPVRRDETPVCDQTGDEWEQAAARLSGWNAPSGIDPRRLMYWVTYMKLLPPKGWTLGGKTRSEIEQSIVVQLAGKAFGASDEQIVEIADEYFAKHQEEFPLRGDDYINRTIASARRCLFDKGWITSRSGGWPRKRDARWRSSTSEDLLRFYELANGQPVAEWAKAVMHAGVSRSTAYRMKDSLCEEGILEVRDGCLHALV